MIAIEDENEKMQVIIQQVPHLLAKKNDTINKDYYCSLLMVWDDEEKIA